MKDRYAKLDMSKLPKEIKDEFDLIKKETKDFSSSAAGGLEANFNTLYEAVQSGWPEAIEKKPKLTKVKPDKVKVAKPKTLVHEYPIHDPEFMKNIRSLAEKKGLKGYSVIISESTGETDKKRLDQIEDIMRHTIFHSTLDWQTAEELGKAAREANQLINEGGLMPISDRFKGEIKDEGFNYPDSLRKRLSEDQIEFIESTLTNDEASTDEDLIEHFMETTGISEAQAKKWVKLRNKYLNQNVGDFQAYNYSTRKKIKQDSRKAAKGIAKDIVSTRDGKEVDRKDDKKNVGKTFYDDNGKAWKCKGYNPKLDECLLEDSEGKQISSCIKDMYVSNPVKKREKGDMIDECKDTLKEAGFTVKEHIHGTKKIKRSEPRPEKEIIKERVSDSFTPILKDISGSEEKDKENKEIIELIESIKGLFTKVMNRISNLADDGRADSLKKIEKLFKELLD